MQIIRPEILYPVMRFVLHFAGPFEQRPASLPRELQLAEYQYSITILADLDN